MNTVMKKQSKSKAITYVTGWRVSIGTLQFEMYENGEFNLSPDYLEVFVKGVNKGIFSYFLPNSFTPIWLKKENVLRFIIGKWNNPKIGGRNTKNQCR